MGVLKTESIEKVYEGKNKSYSVKALNGIDIDIEKGEFVAIMGPSGSGKTTLLNVLSGIDVVSKGNIFIADKILNEMPNNELALFRRQHLGFVFQDFNLLDSLTLKENVMLPLVLDNKSDNDIEEKVKEVMTIFDIYDIKDKYPYTVSGGQQQRAAISRAIINNPDVVFADEPTGNLDSKSSKNVMKYFEKINMLNNITILMVTHDAFAASFCRKTIFIKDGQICSEIIRKNSRENFYENILESLSDIGGEKDEL